MQKTIVYVLISAIFWWSLSVPVAVYPKTEIATINNPGVAIIAVTPGPPPVLIGSIVISIIGSLLKILFSPSCEDLLGDFFEKLGKDFGITELAYRASFSEGNENFGGKIEGKLECQCGKSDIASGVAAFFGGGSGGGSEVAGFEGGGDGEILQVGPPNRALIMVTSNTKKYDHGALNVGNWVLGRTTGNKACEFPEAYEVDFIGTSR